MSFFSWFGGKKQDEQQPHDSDEKKSHSSVKHHQSTGEKIDKSPELTIEDALGIFRNNFKVFEGVNVDESMLRESIEELQELMEKCLAENKDLAPNDFSKVVEEVSSNLTKITVEVTDAVAVPLKSYMTNICEDREVGKEFASLAVAKALFVLGAMYLGKSCGLSMDETRNLTLQTLFNAMGAMHSQGGSATNPVFSEISANVKALATKKGRKRKSAKNFLKDEISFDDFQYGPKERRTAPKPGGEFWN